MFMRWIWRGLVYFLARKAWEAFQRHQAAQRSAAPPGPPARPGPSGQPIQPAPRVRP